MGLSKQAQARARAQLAPAPAPGSGAASRSPRSAPPHSPQPASHGMLGPASWGAKVPTSSYLIVPMGGQPAQVGASGPSAPHLPRARSGTVSRVSLRPPQQVLSVQPALPGILSPQPSTSTSAMGKKMASSANAQMPKPVPSLVSASKRSVQKEPLLKPYPELSKTVRSKFRETLAAALCVDSEEQRVQQSASNGSPIRYSSESKHADDGTVHRPNTCISHGEGNAGTGTGPKSVGSISKQDDILSCRVLGSDMAIKVSKDAQEQSIHVRLENDVLVNNTVVSDELLQDHGPLCAPDIIVGASESIVQLNLKRATTYDIDDGVTISLNVPDFKRTKISDGATGEKNGMMQKGQSLALAIEEELFKLFGEVNKKYKEKGRSLLFNLKDKSNPALRERVLSGDITPKCLCSMTTDELASKELSTWRQAKAEELAKMVVRPNKEVNVRLVRKTHKGEFHVEVEETDTISVGIELESDLLSHGRTKSDDKFSVHREDIESDNIVQDGFAEIGNSNLLSNLKGLANEKTDPIQERMVHDLKYAENLPEMMSLDEFVEAPDSDIPLEYHSTETAQDDPSCTDKAYLALKPDKNHIGEDSANADPSEFEFSCDPPEDNCQASTKSPKKGSNNDFSPDKQPKGRVLIKSSSEMMYAEKLDTGSAPIAGSTMQLKAISDDTLTNESLWEGTIVLTLCSPIDVVAIFKSGEKPSTNEWCRCVEIKGRVRLTEFQEFLEQLPNSKSRTVTVSEMRWKEGSRESVQQQFSQAMDSYAEDEKVGLFKLAKGVELYLCPYQGKAAQILSEHLPKEHSGSQTMAGISVVGVFVWRRSPRISTETPTRLDDSKRQPMSISRKQKAVISSSVPMPSRLTRPPASHFAHSNERPRLEEDATGDSPGFGHGVVKAEADFPEYDFVSVSTGSPSVAIATPHRYQRQQHLQSVSPPADQVNQIVHKYSSMYASGQPLYGGDYLPEWDQSRYDEMQLPPSPVPHVYSLPRQHAMTMQPLWYHRHMLHPAEAQSGWPSGWRFGTHAAHQARFGMDPAELAFLGRAREPWRGSRRPR